MASCNSPRPSTRNDSGVSVFSTRIETLVSSSFCQPLAQVARGQPLAFAARERGIVHGEDHGQRGFVDAQRLERRGVFGDR